MEAQSRNKIVKWSEMEVNRSRMLIGSVTHSIDSKGRYIVPSRYRADLGEKFIVTEGVSGCLFIFTLEQWEVVASALAALPADDEATLCFKRDFFSTAYDLEIDKQFRIVLPPILREYAGLEKDIITVGMGTRLEIWDKQAWEDYRQQTQVPAEKKRAVLAGMVL